jgi:uncharacterized lipoprotein YehR (DUF1307 family)
LPKCYGYGELDRDGQVIAALLTEMSGCGWHHVVRKLRIREISEVSTHIVTAMHMAVVGQMLLTAVNGLYRLQGWHMQDIAFVFNDDTITGTISVKLMSWSGHLKSPFEEPRAKMATAMKALLKSLPGLQRTLHSNLSPAQENLWNWYLQQCMEKISQWWSELNFPIQDFELQELEEQIKRIGVRAASVALELTAATCPISMSTCSPWMAIQTAGSSSSEPFARPSGSSQTGP